VEPSQPTRRGWPFCLSEVQPQVPVSFRHVSTYTVLYGLTTSTLGPRKVVMTTQNEDHVQDSLQDSLENGVPRVHA
jgi:hypothetical protein